MTVADLQSTLRELGRLLDAAGVAKGRSGALTAFADGLEKYRGQTLAAFTGLLERLDPDGAVRPKGKAGGAARAATADVGAVAREARFIYDHAANTDISEDRLGRLVATMEKLKKPELIQVAEAIELAGMAAKTMPVTRDAIRRRLEERIGSTIRRQLDRPAAAAGAAGYTVVDATGPSG